MRSATNDDGGAHKRKCPKIMCGVRKSTLSQIDYSSVCSIFGF